MEIEIIPVRDEIKKKSPANVISIKLVPGGAQGKLYSGRFRIFRRCKINKTTLLGLYLCHL